MADPTASSTSSVRRPEIFISATSRDLRTCRQLVRDALLTLGCVPVVQDHFAPDSRTVREMLHARLAACDAVIHLAGCCYGAEPQERNDPAAPRRSYTQLEFDVARELKKPLYTFLCAEEFPYDPHEPEPEELRLLQQRHRAALTAGDNLYLPIGSPHQLELRVRELQTRLEQLSRDLKRTRSWLARGVAAALVALALVGVVLLFQHQRGQRTEQRAAHAETEIEALRAQLSKQTQLTALILAKVEQQGGGSRRRQWRRRGQLAAHPRRRAGRHRQRQQPGRRRSDRQRASRGRPATGHLAGRTEKTTRRRRRRCAPTRGGN